MSSCLVAHLLSKGARSSSGSEGRNVQLIEDAVVDAEPTWATLGRIALPSFLDLSNVVLSNIGLVWVSSSIYQMTRGSVVVFSAILSVQMLGRRLYSHQYWAIGFVCSAVVLVGIAGIKASGGGDSSLFETLLGLSL